MARKIKRTNAPGTCLWCGGHLTPSPYGASDGYVGAGHFCTLRCGWRFALVFARAGRRLAPYTEGPTGPASAPERGE